MTLWAFLDQHPVLSVVLSLIGASTLVMCVLICGVAAESIASIRSNRK